MQIKKYKTTRGKVRYELIDGGRIVKDNLTKARAVSCKNKLKKKQPWIR